MRTIRYSDENPAETSRSVNVIRKACTRYSGICIPMCTSAFRTSLRYIEKTPQYRKNIVKNIPASSIYIICITSFHKIIVAWFHLHIYRYFFGRGLYTKPLVTVTASV